MYLPPPRPINHITRLVVHQHSYHLQCVQSNKSIHIVHLHGLRSTDFLKSIPQYPNLVLTHVPGVVSSICLLSCSGCDEFFNAFPSSAGFWVVVAVELDAQPIFTRYIKVIFRFNNSNPCDFPKIFKCEHALAVSWTNSNSDDCTLWYSLYLEIFRKPHAILELQFLRVDKI